jgi:hypothetical protein
MLIMVDKRVLTSEEIADAARLDALLKQAKAIDRTYTREFVGDACGWKSSGAVSQFAKGITPLNFSAVMLFVKALKPVMPSIRIEDISPRFAMLLPVNSDHPIRGELAILAAYRKLSPERQKAVEDTIRGLLAVEESGGAGLLG